MSNHTAPAASALAVFAAATLAAGLGLAAAPLHAAAATHTTHTTHAAPAPKPAHKPAKAMPKWHPVDASLAKALASGEGHTKGYWRKCVVSMPYGDTYIVACQDGTIVTS